MLVQEQVAMIDNLQLLVLPLLHTQDVVVQAIHGFLIYTHAKLGSLWAMYLFYASL
jgi:hypothetical protein